MSTLSTGQAAQLTHFCIVGVTCFAFNLATLAVLHEWLGIHYLIAYVTVFVLGNTLGYWLNKQFTFFASSTVDGAALPRYLHVNVVKSAW